MEIDQVTGLTADTIGLYSTGCGKRRLPAVSEARSYPVKVTIDPVTRQAQYRL